MSSALKVWLLALATVALVGGVALFHRGQLPNIIVISLDTLRADRLGLYGYARPTSPNLDAWSSRAAVFERALSPSSWTLPAHVSLFTGQYPTTHDVNLSSRRLGKEPSVLAEELRLKGYATFGYPNGGYTGWRFGLARGFDEYFYVPKKEEPEWRSGLAHAIASLEARVSELNDDKPFFAFVHSYDIHCPYRPPEPYYSMFVKPDESLVETSRCYPHGDSLGMSADQVKQLSDLYDSGIRWTDDVLLKLFRWLDDSGLSDNTFVVILSDHGEEFYEHGRLGHRASVYRELVHVPLMISGPGISSARHKQVVSLVDVMPTLLQLVGAPIPGSVQGLSLVPMLRGESPSDWPSWRYVEVHRGAKLRSSFDFTTQLIKDLTNSKASLFDLVKDPNEQRDIYGPEIHSGLVQRLDGFARTLEEKRVRPAERMREVSTEELRSLGYIR